jgi:hypothetical protein
MCAVRAFLVVGLIAIAGWNPSRAAERVDLLLVLAADVSGSMDESKFDLQRSGYAAAFSNSRVIEAIRGGPSGRIAVAFVEWSGILQQKIVLDWTVISNDETARQFGDHILEAPRAFDRNGTSISAGIDFAMAQLDRAPYDTRRRVIDVSGDGDNNSGRDVTAARDEAIAKGVTINGLVILTETPTDWKSAHTNPLGGLANYYRNNVIGGPGAFVMVAENSNSFRDVLVKKLIAEIAQAVPQQRTRNWRGHPEAKDRMFDHGFRPPFFIFMSPCGGMMLMPVGRPVYLCKLLHPNSPGPPPPAFKPAITPSAPARFVSAIKRRKGRSRCRFCRRFRRDR